MIQIYTAFIAFCMLALVADAQKHKGSLYEFANMMSVALTEKIHLQDLVKRYGNNISQSFVDNTLSLFDSDILPTDTMI